MALSYDGETIRDTSGCGADPQFGGKLISIKESHP
jgi:hypothetical protein